MKAAYLTRGRLEAIVASLTLAIDSAGTDASIEELEAARTWAETVLTARANGRPWAGRSRASGRPPGLQSDILRGLEHPNPVDSAASGRAKESHPERVARDCAMVPAVESQQTLKK